MTTTKFGYTGTMQTFTVPDQCTSVDVDIKGAGGGGGIGAPGGRTTGALAVTPGQVLNIFVGERGLTPSGHTGGHGGWPQGGRGGNSAGLGGLPGGGGGGASDIRVGGTANANRVAIAGGGGGGGRPTSATDQGGQGGPGSGQIGGAGSGGADAGAGGGGGPSAGGIAGAAGTGSVAGTVGALASGGHGGDETTANANAGGGGGGGYYGGGGGGAALYTHLAGGGGGGSCYDGGLTASTMTRGTGAAAGLNGSITLTYNLAPSAPAPNQPTNNGVVDKDSDVQFSWQFRDSDPADMQGAFDLQWRFGAGAWNTKSVSQIASVYTLVAADSGFAAHDTEIVEWQVRTYDMAGAVGPWSASFFFTLHAKPTAPTWTPAPVLNAPAPIGTFAAADGIARWKIRVFHDAAGSPSTEMVFPFGTSGASGAETGFPTTKTATIHDGIPPAPKTGGEKFVNGQSYHFLVSYAHYIASGTGISQPASAVWSSEVDSGPVVCAIDAPLAPTLVLTPDATTASIGVAITNPPGDPHPPDYNIVYRHNLDDGSDEIPIATNIAINGAYSDHAPAAWSNTRYRVVAYRNTNGASTSSA